MRTMEAAIGAETRSREAVRFGWHFVQMFIVMMLGMLPMGIVLAVLGVRNLSQSQPAFFAVIMTVSMVLPMAAWMRFRMGHGWGRTVEMSLAMIAPTVVFVPLCLAGLLPDRAAVGASMTLMPLAMLADMGYRWPEYAHHRHHMSAGPSGRPGTRDVEGPG